MARYPYYRSLSASAKRIYDKSDAIHEVTLPKVAVHRERCQALELALASGDHRRVAAAAQALVSGITRALGVNAVRVRVLAARPKDHGGELHGLYTLEGDGRAHIEVWMRTAAHRRVVAFRTFLRTLLHEVCHHLDFSLFGLAETFHTEGFFRRESSLVRQLGGAAKPKPAARDDAPRAPKPRRSERQLSLFGT